MPACKNCVFKEGIIRSFGDFLNEFLEITFFACENDQCRATDRFLTNVTMFEKEKCFARGPFQN